MADVPPLGSTFTPRQAPDAASYVRRSISASPYRYVARVRFDPSELAEAARTAAERISLAAR
jgi:hypothetical protein